MKAAAQDQWKLLDLAQTDRRIAQAEHRRRTLPELAELKDLAVQRRTLAEEVVAKSTALSDAKMEQERICLLYTSPSPRDRQKSRMPSSA